MYVVCGQQFQAAAMSAISPQGFSILTSIDVNPTVFDREVGAYFVGKRSCCRLPSSVRSARKVATCLLI